MTDTYLYGIPRVELPTYQVKEPVGDAPVKPREGVNHELLDEILSFIKAHPKTWVQDSWYKNVDAIHGERLFSIPEEVTEQNSCGTSFCFAGHTAIHEGFPAPPLDDSITWFRQVKDDDGVYHEDVSDFAREVLGLDYDQSDALFDSSNSLDDIETMIKTLHAYPNVKGWKLDDIRNEELTFEQVEALIGLMPRSWLKLED